MVCEVSRWCGHSQAGIGGQFCEIWGVSDIVRDIFDIHLQDDGGLRGAPLDNPEGQNSERS
jgi:hypothetical protein